MGKEKQLEDRTMFAETSVIKPKKEKKKRERTRKTNPELAFKLSCDLLSNATMSETSMRSEKTRLVQWHGRWILFRSTASYCSS